MRFVSASAVAFGMRRSPIHSRVCAAKECARVESRPIAGDSELSVSKRRSTAAPIRFASDSGRLPPLCAIEWSFVNLS